MALQQLLKEIEPEKYIADAHFMTEFDPSKHKKYDAKYYFQRNTLIPMQEAPRSDTSRLAYNDFLTGLEMVNQMEPLDEGHIAATLIVPEVQTDCSAAGKDAEKPPADTAAQNRSDFHSESHFWRTGDFPSAEGFGVRPASVEAVRTQGDVDRLARKARWERVITERNAAVSMYRFRERLAARLAGFGVRDQSRDPLRSPSICRPAIREATFNILTGPAEAEYSTTRLVQSSMMCLLYCWVLLQQVLGILRAEDAPLVYNRFFELSRLDCLWMFWILKECFFISLVLYYCLVAVLATGAMLVLGPPLLAYFFLFVKGRPFSEKTFRTMIRQNLIPLARTQIGVLALLVLNLSTSWRIWRVVDQIYQKKLNDSFKDFDYTLTTVANLMFTLALVIMLGGQEGTSTSGILSSLGISLVSLLRSMVTQNIKLTEMCDVFTDLNENRLSKFETALVLKTVMERLLDTSIQYNFVQHFYTGKHDPLLPDVAPLTHMTEDPSEAGPLSAGIESGMPNIPESLALEFGHDGRDCYREGVYKGQAVQTVYPDVKASEHGKKDD